MNSADDDNQQELLRVENRLLRLRLNEWEVQMIPKTIVDRLVQLMIDHYIACASTPRQTPQIPLTDRYFAIEMGKRMPLDSTAERKIESLWMNRVNETFIVFRERVATLSLHPRQVKDDRPLPIMTLHDGTQLPIVRRDDNSTQSHLLKNDPCLPGVVIGKDAAKEWTKRGNFSTATDTSIWPGYEPLERLTALWLCRPSNDPPKATLVVDSKLVRQFVTYMVLHDDARCHFTCSGNTHFYAYLCLTANDGRQTDLARLPLGSVIP